MQADLVIINSNILTMNPLQPHAEAIAVNRDHILKVGSNSQIKALIKKCTRILDLKGKIVLPGFIDTHVHIADFGRTLAWIGLKEIGSITAMQNRVRKQVEKITPGKWVLGSGWNQENFKEKRYPTRQDLDAAAPENPVILYHQLGRTCLTNSKALELANLTKDSIDPKDGAIERNPETGEPTGILRGTATDLVWNAVPEPNEQEMVEAAKEAVNKIVEAGITTAHWIVSSATELSVAQKLITENNLDLRIFIITTASVFGQLLIPEPPEQPTKNVSKIGGVLIFEDGYLAAQTAALNEPYMGSSTDKGKLLYTEEELYNLAAKVHKANLQVIIHAMGDKAVNVALKTFEAISRGQSTGKNRHRLEQAALLSKQLVQQIKKQEITVSIQPKVVESEFSAWSAIEHLGKERARMLFPIKTLLKNGICVVGGSDCPMEPLSPISGIHAATTRKYFRNEKLTVEEALRIYTVNAAYATFEENEKGAIEQGKLADLTVLSGDPTSTSIDMLSDIEVEMTIIGGRIAFQKIRS